VNYFEAISLVEQDIVTDGLWETDAKKYTDMRNLLYATAVAIGAELPLSEFSLSTSTEIVANEVPENAPLPSDLFSYRDDRGVRSIVIEGTRYMVSQRNSYNAIVSLAGNSAFVENTDMVFHVDMASKKVFGVNMGPEIDIEYLPMFSEPEDTKVGLQAEDFPLKDKNIREAVSMAGAHLQGNRKRDGQGARFNMVLTNLYGGRNDG